MGFYKIILKTGEQKLINLRSIRAIMLKKNILRFEYIIPELTSFIVLASGDLESKTVYEDISFPSEQEAEKEFNLIHKSDELK